jgi:hypothetical protein
MKLFSLKCKVEHQCVGVFDGIFMILIKFAEFHDKGIPHSSKGEQDRS